MSLFVCEKCGNIENTATGFYWARNRVKFLDPSFNGLALCSECVPEKYDDGSDTGYTGKWHNKFAKEKYDPVLHGTEDFINGHKLRKGDV